MAASLRRSPLSAYLAMALAVVAVFAGLNLVSEPLPRDEGAADRDTALPMLTTTPTPALERDFLTTALGEPRRVERHRYCDAQGCCPTYRITFGTTAPPHDVTAAFEVQGYVSKDGARTRTGPWPSTRWVAELNFAGRWKWRRVEVSAGVDAGRPEWPTVFIEDSIACGSRPG